MNKYICPECEGSRGELKEYINEGSPMRYVSMTAFIPCYYCAGTGYATDEDTYEEFHHEI